MKYSVSFFPDKRNGITKNVPINLSVTFDRQRMIYYTGKRCDIPQFEKLQKKIKNQPPINGQTPRDFQADLDRIELAVHDIFKLYDATQAKPTPAILRNDLKVRLGKTIKPVKDDFFARYDQYIARPGIALKTSKNCSVCMVNLKNFNPDVTFEMIDRQFILNYQNHLIKDPKISKNTHKYYLSQLSYFLMFANKMGWSNNHAFDNFKIEPVSYGKPIYISIAERDILFNAKIESKINEKARDTFILQCLIGCRVGDLMKLTKTNIINENIEYVATKTKERDVIARVPLTQKAKEIISRYDNPHELLVPTIGVHNYNKRIRHIFKEAGLTRLVTVADKKTGENKQVPICDVTSSHMARRVFIGGLFKKGVRTPIIASMSGHSKESKAFSRYYTIDLEDQRGAINMIE